MQIDPILQKIQRLQAAIGGVGGARVADLTSVPKNYVRTESDTRTEFSVYLDVTGGLSDAEVANIAWAIVRSIADLADHFKKWARANGQDPQAVDTAIKRSTDLQLLIDLANLDKHGGHDRDGGLSKRKPTLENIRRVLRLGPKAGFEVVMADVVELRPHGDVALVVDALVKEQSGAILKTLSELQESAISAWEAVVAAWGLRLRHRSEEHTSELQSPI